MLDRRGPLEAAEPRHADGARARRPGRGRCAGRPRSSCSRPDPWRWQAARGPAPGPRPRVRPRGRVPLIGSVATRPSRVDGEERLRATPKERARRAGRPARGPGRGTPRTAPGRRSAGADTGATGRRRTAPRAAGPGWPGRARHGRWPTRTASTPATQARLEACRTRTTIGAARRRPDARATPGGGAWPARASAGATRSRTAPDAGRSARPRCRRPPPGAASHAAPVRRSQAMTQSWSASRSTGRSWSAAAMAGRRSSRRPRS